MRGRKRRVGEGRQGWTGVGMANQRSRSQEEHPQGPHGQGQEGGPFRNCEGMGGQIRREDGCIEGNKYRENVSSFQGGRREEISTG